MVKFILILLIIVILTVGGLSVFLFFGKTNLSGENFAEEGGNEERINEDNTGESIGGENPDSLNSGNENNENEISGGSGGGGGGNGGGGGGGSSGSASESKCEDVQVPYGLKDFLQEENCNEYEGNICVDKDISCSLTVHNLHGSIGGIFKIKFALFKKGDFEILDYSIMDIFLEPNNLERREFVFNLKNSEGENANEETECKFFTESVPKERICS